MRPLKHTDYDADDAGEWHQNIDKLTHRGKSRRLYLEPCPDCGGESFNVTFRAAAVVTDYSDDDPPEVGVDMAVEELEEAVCRVCGESVVD